MRRGLISRSSAELPDAVLDARLARLRAAMADAHLDALVLYTNNTRTAAVSWLTGFVPYWSEALLVVTHGRLPVLVAALTYRVKSWIERVSRLADVIHTPRIGLEAARLIAGTKGDAAVGVVDLDGLSAGIVDDLREGGPRLALRDASALFALLRAKADPAEIALATKAAAIAHEALVQATEASNLGEMVAAIERHARQQGAEEIYIAAAPDLARDHRLQRIEGEAALGSCFALRATVAYKGTWIRLVRTFGHDSLRDQATACFAQAMAQLPDERGLAAFPSWLVEGCRIAQPLEPLMGSRLTERTPLTAGALVSVQASLRINEQTVLLGAPALIGSPGEAACLL
jgi:hypothetical protein